MAKRHLEQYDKNGNMLDIYLNEDEVMVGDQTLAEKLADMEDDIDDAAQTGGEGTVTGIKVGSNTYEPTEGVVDISGAVPTSTSDLSNNSDFTTKAYVDAAVQAVQTALNNLMNGQSVTDAIDTFNEIVDFLDDIDTDDPTLANQLLALNNSITALQTALAGKISGIKTSDNTPLTPDINGIVTLPPAGSTISPATAAPSMDGNNAAVGVSDKYAREDHVHPHDTSKANTSDVYTKTQADTLLAGKQNTLTFDDVPTVGSNNPVKSGGVKQAIDNKLTEVVVNEMSGAADIITIDDADLAFIDEDGNIAMRVAEGHVETQNFDSRQVSTNTSAIQQLQSQIGQQSSAQTDVVVKEDADAAFDIADESGRVALRITSKGHIKTKGFDSENMDIFRATKLDSPQCICHGYGSSTGQANSLTYFRNGLAKGYKFFEVDGVDCRDGVTVCTHSYSTYSVKNKSTGETESIVFSEIDSTDLLTNYTWPNDEPIAMLKDVIWLICYFHRCPLHVDGQGMTKTSRYAASQYAESLGVGQYVFHEIPTPYTDWDIPCNVIMDAGSVSNIATQAARYKKANNNILFYFASNFYSTDEALKALADAAHENGCYLISWTFNNIDTIRNWFKQGADFLITSGIVNSQV
jgi:glycerophosphoryl diester phosphodiesterase